MPTAARPFGLHRRTRSRSFGAARARRPCQDAGMGPRSAILGSAVLFIATLVALGSRTPAGAPNAALACISSLVVDGGAPLLWMVAALGLGSLVRGASLSMRLGAGAAMMLALDQFAGSLGAFGTPLGAWLMLAPGLVLAARCAARGALRERAALGMARLSRCWPLAPGIAVLLFAATSSPGFLWSTEFAGYDALSYHLPLPRAWLDSGAIAPLPWNAYASLPGWVEGAFLHCFALGGDPTLMGIRAQLLHAALAITALAMTGEAAWHAIAASQSAPTRVRVMAAAALLGAPWIVVTGSLAYNEMGAVLGIAGMIAAWFGTSDTTLRRGALLGLFAACAVGSKLSAGVIALPAVVILFAVAPCSRHQGGASAPTRSPRLAAPLIGAVLATLLLTPWLARNAAATGNPIFPFATALFGSHDWTAQQIDSWNRAHSAEGGAIERLGNLWNQVIVFGLGPPPDANERWRPFMGVLPWLALAGAAIGLAARPTRRLSLALLAALLAGAVAWLLATHMKSRFMVPLMPIAAVAVSLGVEVILRASSRSPIVRGRFAPWIALCMSLAPMAAFLSEGPAPAAMIGAERVATGDALASLLADPTTRHVAETFDRSRAFVLNHEIAPQARASGRSILLIGDAETFRYRVPFRASTVWTRDPLVSAMLDAQDGAAARRLLTDAGIGWVLVHPTMLEVWTRSGWLDPALTPERLARAIEALEPLRRFDDGALLLRVGADTVMNPNDRPRTGPEPP